MKNYKGGFWDITGLKSDIYLKKCTGGFFDFLDKKAIFM